MLVKRSTKYFVCSHCGFWVTSSHHTKEHCLLYRRVVELRRSRTLEQVGRELGITRQRVHQILRYSKGREPAGQRQRAGHD